MLRFKAAGVHRLMLKKTLSPEAGCRVIAGRISQFVNGAGPCVLRTLHEPNSSFFFSTAKLTLLKRQRTAEDSFSNDLQKQCKEARTIEMCRACGGLRFAHTDTSCVYLSSVATGRLVCRPMQSGCGSDTSALPVHYPTSIQGFPWGAPTC